MYKKIPKMHVEYVRVGAKWLWEIYDSQGKLFAISAKTYGRRGDARRAFERLDVLF
jgi:hypothetical protein